MRSDVKTVEEYLNEIPLDQLGSIKKVRKEVLENLPDGYEEGMLYGMIGYYIPLSEYSETYNGQPLVYVSIGAQKNYISVYLMGIYSDDELRKWFEGKYKESGKKMNIGKSCVRFKSYDDLPKGLVGEAVTKITPQDYIEIYEASRGID